MATLFNSLLYRPLLNGVVFFYTLFPAHDFGLAIVILTLVVRVILSPLSVRAVRSQRALSVLQPKINEIKEKHKNDQAAQGAAVMELYRQHKVNPLAGCLPLLIQIPIIAALYRVFLAGFKPENLALLYGFVRNPGVISTLSFGRIDIAVGNWILAILAGLTQFVQGRLSMAFMPQAQKGGELAVMNAQMTYFFPLLIVFISWSRPAGLALYWITTTLVSIGEQIYIKHTSPSP